MRILSVGVGLLLVGCGKPDTTFCGMSLHPNQPQLERSWTVHDLQEAEDYTIMALSETVINDDRFESTRACAALQGTVVIVRPEKLWKNLSGDDVAGEATCPLKTINIAGFDGDMWDYAPLPHEIAHIIQNCEPRRPLIVHDFTVQTFYHQHWDTDKILEGIEVAHAEKTRARNAN